MTRALDDPADGVPLRFSVVIPTFERRDLVLAAVAALGEQRIGERFEAVVVVDGSRDGTATALRRLATPFPLTVLEQENRGAASARAAGAAAARGEILLFLDDDMEAQSDLLAEHDAEHREGADAVLGHIPLHPASPRNFLSAGVGRWAEERRLALARAPHDVDLENFLTGQLSVSRRAFDAVGGFDTSFNREGGYGNEDFELGLRLRSGGFRIVFRQSAVSWQRYVVTPRHYLRQYEQAGAATVALVRKHPEAGERLFGARRPESTGERWGFRLFGAAAAPVVVALLATRWASPRLERWFYRLSDLGFWRGVRRAGGKPEPRPLRVLAWHAIADLAGAPLVAEYGTPVVALRAQLRALRRCGFRFVSEDELLRYLHAGGGLPRRAVLLTFDDAFAELLDTALPACREQGAPAMAFAVSARVGGFNEWDAAQGAPRLALAGVGALRGLERGGVAIGSHGRTHRRLTDLDDTELERELAGSAAELSAMGLAPVRSLAYPFGAADARVRGAARRAGYRVGFGVEPGIVAPGSDPWALPRLEVFRRDTGLRFLSKVLLAGRGWRSVVTMARFALADLFRSSR